MAPGASATVAAASRATEPTSAEPRPVIFAADDRADVPMLDVVSRVSLRAILGQAANLAVGASSSCSTIRSTASVDGQAAEQEQVDEKCRAVRTTAQRSTARCRSEGHAQISPTGWPGGVMR